MRRNCTWEHRTGRLRWVAVVPLAVVGLGGCATTTPARESVTAELVQTVGAPFPDAVLDDALWRQGAGAWYDHGSDVATVIAWYRDLPDRLGCNAFELSDLEPPRAGYFAIYELECTVDREGVYYVIGVMTVDAIDRGSTSIGVRVD